MKKLSDNFHNVEHYILDITYRIWEQKQLDLCHNYYAKDCPVYTLAGITIGVDEVISNTQKTLHAFPDRSLTGEAVLWCGTEESGFHSSHRIRTHMTNKDESEFGAATGKEADFLVIAHCIIKGQKIVEEWLMRDNYALAQQLGFTPEQVAIELAKKSMQPRLADWIQSEHNRIKANDASHNLVLQSKHPLEQFIRQALHSLWSNSLDYSRFYSPFVRFESMAGRAGRLATVIQYYQDWLQVFTELQFSIDCITCNDTNFNQIAVRWTMSAKHTKDGIYGTATNADILILGESHYQIVAGLIVQEWTVFDELTVIVQIMRHRKS